MPPGQNPEELKQITLQPGQYAWCRDEQKGSLRLYVGPVRLTPTDDDVFLKQDPDDPSRLIPVAFLIEAVQNFITIQSGHYAVIHNPVKQESNDRDYPNGKYGSDKNSLIDLDYGKTRVLTEGFFPIWPGQRVEIRPVHELQSNEYLIARVVDANRVDTNAPFYQLTLDCASTTEAVVDAAEIVPSSAAAEPGQEDTEEKKKETSLVGNDKSSQDAGGSGSKTPPTKPAPAEQPQNKLTTGQQIVIPGSKTPIYIPPTGIEVMPDTSVDESGRPVTADYARVLLMQFERKEAAAKKTPEIQKEKPQRGGPRYRPEEIDPRTVASRINEKIRRGEMNRRSIVDRLGPSERLTFEGLIDQYKGVRREDDTTALIQAVGAMPSQSLLHLAESTGLFEEPEMNVQKGTIGQTAVEELKTVAEGPRIVRQAVVLGPTEFCVLLDADGNPQIHKGPGRVFPGPYDRFQTKGSRNRVYDAYHLRSDRGLLIRIVAERITRDDLAKVLPEGLKSGTLDKDKYLKGDEVFIKECDAYLVPANSFEVIDPVLRLPHIGNDHTSVYVEAIGVDQKSGVYVMNVDTGQVDLVRGEKKLLLDPRKQRHVKRRVPGTAWNLMIGRAEPHKKVRDDGFEVTPWALSVIVPNNEAVLVTSKEGRRVVVGPCTELLGFEEWLEKLSLSRGRPKSEVDRNGQPNKVDTCFLRVSGNRVTDQIDLITKDFVTIRVDVSYGVTFVGKTQDERFMWFDHRNYVRLLYTHLRSLLRAAARKKTLMELQPIVPDFIRDVILGEKKEGEHRPGCSLPNNMLVDEVEVLDIVIPDNNVATAMLRAQLDTVVREITDKTALSMLESEKLRAQIAQEKHDLALEEIERKKKQDLTTYAAAHVTESTRIKLAHERDMITEESNKALSDLQLKTRLEQEQQEAEAEREADQARAELDNTILKTRNETQLALDNALAEIEKALVKENAAAVVSQLGAIQPGLIEAIEGLGDKQILSSLSEHLPEAGGTLGFLLSQGGLEAVKAMIAGTRLAKTLETLQSRKTPSSSEPAGSGRTE